MASFPVSSIRILILSWAFCMIFITSCSQSAKETEAPASSDTQAGEAINYLALGDSYTIGESVEAYQRWPLQLADSLRARNWKVPEPVIIARTGWTTDELKAGIVAAALKDTFNLVSLLIGVNNQFRGQSLEEYEFQFEELLGMAIGFASADTHRVFVVSIPDYGVTPFAQSRNPEQIGREIDALNAAAARICQSYKVPFYSITAISREASDDLQLLASDQLHPSGKMYSRWVAGFINKVNASLE